MLLLVIQLKVETGDSLSRSMFVLLSLPTGVLAPFVGYLEFERTLVDTDSLLSYDQEALDRPSRRIGTENRCKDGGRAG